MEDRYLSWLISLIDHKGKSRVYSRLLEYLYFKDFEYTIGNDDNRAADGEQLRVQFLGKTNHKGCSCLEMLVALARRCERDIMGDPEEPDKAYKWFWIMIRNLGLDELDNRNFDEGEADYIVDRWLERRYKKTGKGGLFPLRYSEEDQRKVEIWYQMCAYLNENYSFV